eukprot:395236-Rhodomonas_salina.2
MFAAAMATGERKDGGVCTVREHDAQRRYQPDPTSTTTRAVQQGVRYTRGCTNVRKRMVLHARRCGRSTEVGAVLSQRSCEKWVRCEKLVRIMLLALGPKRAYLRAAIYFIDESLLKLTEIRKLQTEMADQ